MKNDTISLELQRVLSLDVVNLRCLPVARASVEAAPRLQEVSIPPLYVVKAGLGNCEQMLASKLETIH